MVLQIITKKLQAEMARMFKFYDEHGHLPNEKSRMNISLSNQTLFKLKGIKNKSRFIEDCVINRLAKSI